MVWSYCGIRPLFDDGVKNVSRITRDYTLRVDGDTNTAPVLSVFGGKITTYRKLAEHALEKLSDWFPQMKAPWTEGAQLPGGDLDGGSLQAYIARVQDDYLALPGDVIAPLVRRHGGTVNRVLGDAKTMADLGAHFGGDLYAREVDYLMAQEWACSAEDVLWRRTKVGLHVNAMQKQALASYMADHAAPAVR